METIASVVVSNSTRQFDKEYSYRIPEGFASKVKPGVRVVVPFGRSNRSLEGIVFDVCYCEENSGSLKSIKEVLDGTPVLRGNMIALAKWMKNRYLCTYYDAIKCMVPPGSGIKANRVVCLQKNAPVNKAAEQKIVDALVQYECELDYNELRRISEIKSFSKHIENLVKEGIIGIREQYKSNVREKFIRVAYIQRPVKEIEDAIASNQIRRIQHIRVLEMLMETEYLSVSDIVRFSGVSSSVLDTLKKYGYLDYKNIEVVRDPYKNRVMKKTYPLAPTEEQAEVLNKTKGLMEKQDYAEVLLHGVTGSGKTEVYLQLIQHCFDQGKQAIVLVPEISLTPQMVERFKGRFGDYVAVQHSRLSLGERYDQWRLIRDGSIKVVVGARSAVFAPFENLGLIIIDEEHEPTYKSEITPKYHAREIARERCKIENAVLLNGSATPDIHTYYKAQKGEIHWLTMEKRANAMMMPKVELVDMREELNDGNRSVFSTRLLEEIQNNMQSGHQTLLFLNRRGHSSFVLCRNCGYSARCRYCNVALTYHKSGHRLICHYCGYTTVSPPQCPKCKSNHIRHFGTGTQRVEEELKRQFPDCSVLRMDMDTTTYKNSHENILRTFREENTQVMIGTQMIAKGHDFPNVTLVGVLAADSLLNMGEFYAAERTFQLLTQVAGRAGRGQFPGRVIIQTYNVDNYSIKSACTHDYEAFYKQEIDIRRRLNYPPFTYIACIILSGRQDRQVYIQANKIKEQMSVFFEGQGTEVAVLGPARSPLSKINNKFRWRMIIKCTHMAMLIDGMEAIARDFYKNKEKEKEKVELSIDINPVNML